MVVGPATTSPIGHHLFCGERPSDCRIDPAQMGGPLPLDEALLRRVSAINVAVNASIAAKSDRDLYGVEERWTYPDAAKGDCEDYALLKRRDLLAIGIKGANLLMTVVRKRNGEGHAVLTLRTTKGDYVLDNLSLAVRRWRETPYTFVKRQSSDNPRRWVSIEDGADLVVGSVRK
ncbi:hypothetical protein ASG43_17115 [Aureimonas sp. Leaf454]|nr:transglutaminase-like cysteine peptidase [Aureimonas sp. Leaf454]KQT42003.1 hypothetical protein ASG43_17115 [Aureimonas sp. Leaf454]